MYFKQKYAHSVKNGRRISLTREMVVKKVAEVVRDFIEQVLEYLHHCLVINLSF